jgi:hypothetical protein
MLRLISCSNRRFAGQFAAVLVLLILGLERADADAVVVGQDGPSNLDLHHAAVLPLIVNAADLAYLGCPPASPLMVPRLLSQT